MRPVRVLVCRVGRRPVVEELYSTNGDRGLLASMQGIVGGLLTCVQLEDIDLWCNDEGLLMDWPINRVIPAIAPQVPEGFELIVLGDPEELARPGEPGVWKIRGPFFLARNDGNGRIDSVTDADVRKYTEMWWQEDDRAAEQMLRLLGDVHR